MSNVVVGLFVCSFDEGCWAEFMMIQMLAFRCLGPIDDSIAYVAWNEKRQTLNNSHDVSFSNGSLYIWYKANNLLLCGWGFWVTKLEKPGSETVCTCCFCMMVIRSFSSYIFRLSSTKLFSIPCEIIRSETLNTFNIYIKWASEVEMFTYSIKKSLFSHKINVWIEKCSLRGLWTKSYMYSTKPRLAILNWNITQAVCH